MFSWYDETWETLGDLQRIKRIATAAVCAGMTDQQVADYINAERPVASTTKALTPEDAINLLTVDEVDAGALDTGFVRVVSILGYKGDGLALQLLQDAVLDQHLAENATTRYAAAVQQIVMGSIARLSLPEGGLGMSTANVTADDVARARLVTG